MGKLIDISMEGACLNGTKSPSIKKDAILSPMTLILCLEGGGAEKEIQVEEAKVMWVVPTGNSAKQFFKIKAP